MEAFGKHTHTQSTTLLYSTPLHSTPATKTKLKPKKTLKNDKRSKNPQNFGGETETEESCERERRRLFKLQQEKREFGCLFEGFFAFVCSPFWLHLARCAERSY
jgi:hypothetical protein